MSDDKKATNLEHSKVTETATTTTKMNADGSNVTTTVRTVEFE